MGTWEEEWLDMTKESVLNGWSNPIPGLGPISMEQVPNRPPKEFDWSDPIPGLGPISMEQAQGTVSPTPPTTWNPTGGGEQFLRAGSGSTAPVKIATPQYVDILNKTTFSPILEGLLYFEQINGLMLLSLTNNANLDTENVNYQPIVNMAEVQRSLDPKGVLALQNTSEKYFLNFPIRLETRIPNDGNGPSGTNVYINFSTGNLVIESINLNVGEKIEIETLQNGTIYETDLGVDES
jgi:hypothetical protein